MGVTVLCGPSLQLWWPLFLLLWADVPQCCLPSCLEKEPETSSHLGLLQIRVCDCVFVCGYIFMCVQVSVSW